MSELGNQITVRFHERTLRRLNRASQAKFITRVEYVRKAVETALSKDLPETASPEFQLKTNPETIAKLKALSETLEPGSDVLAALLDLSGLG